MLEAMTAWGLEEERGLDPGARQNQVDQLVWEPGLEGEEGQMGPEWMVTPGPLLPVPRPWPRFLRLGKEARRPREQQECSVGERRLGHV
jgi:hypothetical protein